MTMRKAMLIVVEIRHENETTFNQRVYVTAGKTIHIKPQA
jgi:hypothetical protein